MKRLTQDPDVSPIFWGAVAVAIGIPALQLILAAFGGFL